MAALSLTFGILLLPITAVETWLLSSASSTGWLHEAGLQEYEREFRIAMWVTRRGGPFFSWMMLVTNNACIGVIDVEGMRKLVRVALRMQLGNIRWRVFDLVRDRFEGWIRKFRHAPRHLGLKMIDDELDKEEEFVEVTRIDKSDCSRKEMIPLLDRSDFSMWLLRDQLREMRRLGWEEAVYDKVFCLASTKMEEYARIEKTIQIVKAIQQSRYAFGSARLDVESMARTWLMLRSANKLGDDLNIDISAMSNYDINAGVTMPEYSEEERARFAEEEKILKKEEGRKRAASLCDFWKAKQPFGASFSEASKKAMEGDPKANKDLEEATKAMEDHEELISRLRRSHSRHPLAHGPTEEEFTQMKNMMLRSERSRRKETNEYMDFVETEVKRRIARAGLSVESKLRAYANSTLWNKDLRIPTLCAFRSSGATELAKVLAAYGRKRDQRLRASKKKREKEGLLEELIPGFLHEERQAGNTAPPQETADTDDEDTTSSDDEKDSINNWQKKAGLAKGSEAPTEAEAKLLAETEKLFREEEEEEEEEDTTFETMYALSEEATKFKYLVAQIIRRTRTEPQDLGEGTKTTTKTDWILIGHILKSPAAASGAKLIPRRYDPTGAGGGTWRLCFHPDPLSGYWHTAQFEEACLSEECTFNLFGCLEGRMTNETGVDDDFGDDIALVPVKKLDWTVASDGATNSTKSVTVVGEEDKKKLRQIAEEAVAKDPHDVIALDRLRFGTGDSDPDEYGRATKRQRKVREAQLEHVLLQQKQTMLHIAFPTVCREDNGWSAPSTSKDSDAKTSAKKKKAERESENAKPNCVVVGTTIKKAKLPSWRNHHPNPKSLEPAPVYHVHGQKLTAIAEEEEPEVILLEETPPKASRPKGGIEVVDLVDSDADTPATPFVVMLDDSDDDPPGANASVSARSLKRSADQKADGDKGEISCESPGEIQWDMPAKKQAAKGRVNTKAWSPTLTKAGAERKGRLIDVVEQGESVMGWSKKSGHNLISWKLTVKPVGKEKAIYEEWYKKGSAMDPKKNPVCGWLLAKSPQGIRSAQFECNAVKDKPELEELGAQFIACKMDLHARRAHWLLRCLEGSSTAGAAQRLQLDPVEKKAHWKLIQEQYSKDLALPIATCQDLAADMVATQVKTLVDCAVGQERFLTRTSDLYLLNLECALHIDPDAAIPRPVKTKRGVDPSSLPVAIH